jgi:uncharacterized protein YegP (UPF0339 family)
MHFRIYQDANGDWHWAIFQSGNRKVAEASVTYWDKQECLAAVDAMRQISTAPIFFKSPPAPASERRRSSKPAEEKLDRKMV